MPTRRSPAASSTGNAVASGPDIDQYVSALLTASRALVAISARSLASVEDHVTVPQFRALVVASTRGETNLNRLADDLGVAPSSAVRMIDRLLAAGLVTRRQNPHNRREVLIGLTPAGAGIVETVTSARRRELARVVASMPANERSPLIEALDAFARATGEPPGLLGDARRLGW